MTESEAKEYMENEVECIKRASHCDRDCLNCELVKEEEPLIESYGMAIQALEEIQLYHELGTTTEIIGQQYELQTFQAIGTVEEFKALKEKSVAKKVIRLNDNGYYDYKCPTCGMPDKDCMGKKYCNCGQALET